MKPFPVPVVPIGPGSQPEEDDTLDYMVMPQGMETYRPPVMPEREAVVAQTGAHEALRAVLAALARALGNLPAHPVDLATLSDADRQLINQVLGEGEVSVRVQGEGGELVIQESVFAGVWRVMRRSMDASTGQWVVSADQIEVGRMPLGVIEAASHAAVPAAQRRLQGPAATGSWPAGVMNAPSVLNELEDRVQAWRPGVAAHVINLTLLPLSPEDLAAIDQSLGQGPVLILSRGYGNCRIMLTEVPMCWRVSYYNSQDALILDTLEVTDMPEVACAASEDLMDSQERLADLLQWVEGS
jgi:hydrogenase-1 operon protein HyaF